MRCISGTPLFADPSNHLTDNSNKFFSIIWDNLSGFTELKQNMRVPDGEANAGLSEFIRNVRLGGPLSNNDSIFMDTQLNGKSFCPPGSSKFNERFKSAPKSVFIANTWKEVNEINDVQFNSLLTSGATSLRIICSHVQTNRDESRR